MNRVISDTAEYGCYLFANACVPLLKDFMATEVTKEDIGFVYGEGKTNEVDNAELIAVNASIRNHPVEEIGAWLRARMTGMAKIV
jgi:ketol-acid reductoisomerase